MYFLSNYKIEELMELFPFGLTRCLGNLVGMLVHKLISLHKEKSLERNQKDKKHTRSKSNTWTIFNILFLHAQCKKTNEKF